MSISSCLLIKPHYVLTKESVRRTDIDDRPLPLNVCLDFPSGYAFEITSKKRVKLKRQDLRDEEALRGLAQKCVDVGVNIAEGATLTTIPMPYSEGDRINEPVSAQELALFRNAYDIYKEQKREQDKERG